MALLLYNIEVDRVGICHGFKKCGLPRKFFGKIAQNIIARNFFLKKLSKHNRQLKIGPIGPKHNQISYVVTTQSRLKAAQSQLTADQIKNNTIVITGEDDIEIEDDDDLDAAFGAIEVSSSDMNENTETQPLFLNIILTQKGIYNFCMIQS